MSQCKALAQVKVMQRNVMWIGACILVLGVWMMLGAPSRVLAAEAPEAQLAEHGEARLPITLVDPTGDFAEAFLIEPSLKDLQQTLHQITDATFEQNSVKAVAADASPAIYVGTAKDLQALGVPQDLKLQECYIATTSNGSLVLSGNTIARRITRHLSFPAPSGLPMVLPRRRVGGDSAAA